jgi:hypothetical protein
MAQENNNKQQFQCSGNCLNCQPAQRQYCASQHSFSNMKVLDNMMELLKKMQADMLVMQGSITEMAAKVEAIQNNEASVFSPNGEGELFPKEFRKEE